VHSLLKGYAEHGTGACRAQGQALLGSVSV
jgi:hypothetical protein